MNHINDGDLRLRFYRLRRHHQLKRHGLCLIESQKVVHRALASSWQVQSLLVSEQQRQKLPQSLTAGCEILVCERDILRSVAGFPLHQDILGLAAVPANAKLDQLGNRILALEGLSDAENLGTIIRTAMAMGVTGILVDEKTCWPYARRVIRVSMGAIFHCPLRIAVDWHGELLGLKKQGFTLISTSEKHPAVHLSAFANRRDLKRVFLLGSEGEGLSDLTSRLSHINTRIPQTRLVDSLNVASAAAILIYEIFGRWLDEDIAPS